MNRRFLPATYSIGGVSESMRAGNEMYTDAITLENTGDAKMPKHRGSDIVVGKERKGSKMPMPPVKGYSKGNRAGRCGQV